MHYRKRPVTIKAVQFFDAPETLVELSKLGLDPVNVDYSVQHKPILKIQTLEGVMTANVGDYIIKGVKGEFYPCKPDIFEDTYEEVKYLNVLDSI
ncbi:hypothetical protein Javan253_0042 [Streptococcus phage Javan253]|uniref:hypothetical protein n=1 Tax=Streptococcus henryi TaxID=439219 RepID=UPI00036FFFBD|nr:hypothetical protein [Streptococcus henryi]QBX16498.1 hypothetical protein Javan253_0042 [Streptococcus phage Javan253]